MLGLAALGGAAWPLLRGGTATAAGDAGWDIVKIDGRDYITGESIHKFYRFTTITKSGKSLVLRSPTLQLNATAGSQELFINRVKFILSDSAKQTKGTVAISRMDLVKLVDPILRPSYIRTDRPFDTVIIDPGHGGHDGGAPSIYGPEKNFALDTGRKLRELLTKRGYKVTMTREGDTYPSLPARVNLANKVPSAVFISIHFNSGQSAATGIETFALSPQGATSTYESSKATDARNFQGNARDSENIALATAIHASVLYNMSAAVDRGVKRARFAVLRGINKPAVLFEGGFLSNRGEARKIATSAYRQTLANAIADAVANYRKAITKKP
ncbi:hypothetical protein BH23VER1_BH23VER1_24220 [soil metagenome]